MFNFMKKDRDKDKKERKEKKKDKKKDKEREHSLNTSDMNRLEEIKHSYVRNSFERKGTDLEDNNKLDVSPTGSLLFRDRSETESSEASFNSLDRTKESSPGSSTGKKLEINRKIYSPTKGPPVPPKSRGILKGISSYGPEIPNQGVHGNIDDSEVLVSNTLANETLPIRILHNNTENKSNLNSTGILLQRTNDSENLISPQSPLSHTPAGESLGEHGKTFDFELKLPALSPPKLPRSRFVEIKRQPTGDFGFSLRRATILDRGYGDNTEKKRMILYAEPITIGKSNTTGLLPGDRLLEVNGINVEQKSRDEVIDLIKNSGEIVSLKVQTVLELSELTMRSGLDGSDIPLDEVHVKEGSLQRSGSKRYKKITAKTEDQLSSDLQLLEDERVWLIHKGGFAAARLLKPSSPTYGSPSSEGTHKVKLEHNGQILEVEADDIEKANPNKLDRVEDLSQLHYLNESSFLHTIRQRYGSNLIHTYAGPNMIIVNPMHPLSIYSDKVIQMFKGCKSEDMPPHIYATAQNALRQMISSRADQSVVLMGRSGSGKTSNFKYLLHYLAIAAGAGVNIVTVEKLNSIATLMEAFGNSRTMLNTNATRFTQLFSMDFDHSGQIVSGSVQISMLEKLRLIRRPEGESTFHIFYQLLAGCDPSQRNELFLNSLSEPCMFMTPLQRSEDKSRACMAWARILAACDILGIKPEESRTIWNVLAAIFHLGVAGAVQGANNTKGKFANPAAAQRAATLLGVTPEELARRVFSTPQTLAVRTSFRSSSDKVTLPEKPLDALEALEGMVVGLYCETFATLVALINRSLSSNYRTQSSILVLDCPGFQNPASCGRTSGATFEEFCHNYLQEKLQLLYHDLTFTLQQDRYIQENIDYDLASALTSSPVPMVILMDKPSQQSLIRSSSLDRNRNSNEERGLLWVLDEEAIFPGSSDESFIDRVLTLHQQQIKKKNGLIKGGPQSKQLILQHFQGTNPVIYNVSGWLKSSRDYSASRNAAPLLQESQKEVSNLFLTLRGPGSGAVTGSCAGIESNHSLRRASSIRRTSVSTANIKKKSVCLQVKFQVDAIIDVLWRTKVHFVHCILPQHNAGLCDLKTSLLMPNKTNSQEDIMLNVPLVRSQLRGFQIIDAVRCHKQGYPEHFTFGEFRQKFGMLATSEENVLRPNLDDKQMVENLLNDIDLEKTSYKLGLSQIFFRAGALTQLEDARDKKITGTIIQLQAYCRGYLGCQKLKKLKVQELAVRCIQRNVRKFLAVSTWPWWRLLIKVFPLLNVHRTEEELRAKTEELEILRLKVNKLEKERNDFKQAVDRLEAKLSDLSADYVEERSTSTNAAELLDAETAERMKLEKTLEELQIKHASLQQKCDRMEMEVMETRMLRVTDIDGDLDEDELDGDSIYRPKYERIVRELDFTKKKMQQQMEDELEQQEAGRKQLERKLTEILEEADEQRQLASNWKKKAQKSQSEMQDIRLLLEEQTGRNADLEKRQRKFDSELAKVYEEVKQEKHNKEKCQRERDSILSEKYTLEHELERVRADFDAQKEKIEQLESEIQDLSNQPLNDMEIIQLKKIKHELEIKTKDQEEELDDLAGQVQLLQQTKLRLEVGNEKLRQQHQKELEMKEEEVEELRVSTQKRVKQLEQQLEDEYEERHSLTKAKHELERKLHDMSDHLPKRDAETENRLKKELRCTKALLRDAQTVLQNSKDNAPSRALIKQLKNQLEDADFAKVSATKAKQSVEMELQELQQQLDDALRSKANIEDKCMQLTREKNDLQSHLDDNEEELQDIMKKYKAVANQISIDQITLNDQSTHISELLNEKEQLKEQLATASSKIEYLEENTVDRQHASRLEIKVKELETKLELEQTTRHRLEVQISRLKESIDKLISENASLKANEERAQEICKRLERQFRDLKEDYAELQRKEAEASQRKHDLEMALENAEVDHETTRSDLKLAFKRIEDLQSVISDTVATDSDDGSLSNSDSESSSEADMFLNHKSSPIRRGGGESPAATPKAQTTMVLSTSVKSELDC